VPDHVLVLVIKKTALTIFAGRCRSRCHIHLFALCSESAKYHARMYLCTSGEEWFVNTSHNPVLTSCLITPSLFRVVPVPRRRRAGLEPRPKHPEEVGERRGKARGAGCRGCEERRHQENHSTNASNHYEQVCMLFAHGVERIILMPTAHNEGMQLSAAVVHWINQLCMKVICLVCLSDCLAFCREIPYKIGTSRKIS